MGLDNYLAFFVDPLLAEAIGHIGVLVIFYAVLPITLGLLSAALLARFRRPGFAVFRWVIFLPQVLTSVVVAVLWKQLYGPGGPDQHRAAGHRARRAGQGLARRLRPGPARARSGRDLDHVRPVHGAVRLRLGLDLHQPVRRRAGGRRRLVREFFAVTLPGLRPQIAVALTLTVTGGAAHLRPGLAHHPRWTGDSTVTPSFLLYTKAFAVGDVGAAAAIGVVMAVTCLLVALVIVRLVEREG